MESIGRMSFAVYLKIKIIGSRVCFTSFCKPRVFAKFLWICIRIITQAEACNTSDHPGSLPNLSPKRNTSLPKVQFTYKETTTKCCWKKTPPFPPILVEPQNYGSFYPPKQTQKRTHTHTHTPKITFFSIQLSPQKQIHQTKNHTNHLRKLL